MRTTTILVVIGLAAAMLVGTPAAACAQTGIYIRLDGFSPESSPTTRFYVAEESDGSTTFRVKRQGDNCDFTTASVRYSSTDVTAVNGRDYRLDSNRTIDLHDPNHPSIQGAPSYQDVPIQLIDDTETQATVRKAIIQLSEPQNAILVEPFSAPFYLVDDDGPTRFSFAEPSYSQAENLTKVSIPVFRAGDASAAASVQYEVGPGPEPTATPGEDFTVTTPGALSFSAGQRVANITLDLVADGRDEPDENVRLTLLSEASGIGSTDLTIVDTDEAPPEPRSRFHHPREGLRYEYNDYRIREVHVFTKDTTGFGVVRAQFALRRTMDNGRCAWLDGTGFQRGSCDSKRWLKMKVYDPGYFYYYRLKALRPTAGTNVKNYTGYSRAFDSEGNAETTFRIGKNANTFKIKRR